MHACLHVELLVPLAAKMSEEPFRLIIMDSVTANLRVDFTGRGACSCAACDSMPSRMQFPAPGVCLALAALRKSVQGFAVDL